MTTIDTYDYGPLPSESPMLEALATAIRTDDLSDHDVLAVGVATMIFTALTLGKVGEVMTPEQIGAAAALVLVDKAGFHRRHQC
ncbi:hypothetical protein [Nocardia jiangxiensis]|uniref:hypothetical protein n=1 Tax=Nocardia jiangxiensis TaxID=282685 RepID=UPI000311F5CF|nr:hypothetical protein [Nocardia jiangxiensis]